MINKKSVWFLTLFSLILVLSIYYITMPSEMLLTTRGDYENKETEKESEETTEEETEVTMKESDLLTSLRVEANDEMTKEMEELKTVLNSEDATSEEKNDAFERMKKLNSIRGEEESLEKKLKSDLKLESFIKIDGDQIRVVVNTDSLDKTSANNIMRTIQAEYDKKMYISVKFQK